MVACKTEYSRQKSQLDNATGRDPASKYVQWYQGRQPMAETRRC